MGKLIYFTTVLIIFDLFFIATGQICNSPLGCSFNSMMLGTILNLENLSGSQFFTQLIGNVSDFFTSSGGIATLATAGGVSAVTFAAAPRTIRFFIPIALALSITLVSDLVFITSYLISINAVLGTFIMAPILIIAVMTVMEWLRGKD